MEMGFFDLLPSKRTRYKAKPRTDLSRKDRAKRNQARYAKRKKAGRVGSKYK